MCSGAAIPPDSILGPTRCIPISNIVFVQLRKAGNSKHLFPRTDASRLPTSCSLQMPL